MEREEIEALARKEILDTQAPTSNVHGQYIGFQKGYAKAIEHIKQPDLTDPTEIKERLISEYFTDFANNNRVTLNKNGYTFTYDANRNLLAVGNFEFNSQFIINNPTYHRIKAIIYGLTNENK